MQWRKSLLSKHKLLLINFTIIFSLLLPICLLSLFIYCGNSNIVSWSLPWSVALGVDLSFRFDGLSRLFAMLILFIGIFIVSYSISYFKPKDRYFSFYFYLNLFMLSMLALVLSDNIILIYIFWELTTITSFLLIGFKYEQEKARANALQSMLVTSVGGLSLLAGFILLGQVAGTYSLSAILHQTAVLKNNPLFCYSFPLILLGAITKSAQFPFHFWLPNAMVAPTPVSAYLHSATMVKAGIYLLARLSPVYAGSNEWLYSLGGLGAITALWSAIQTLKQTDLKLMLAYSTNTALGKLMLLLAIGNKYAVSTASLFIISHALYKAALFMVVGNIDKATGLRDLTKLSGLKTTMTLSFVASIFAVSSKIGLPPFLGFLSKEYMYKACLELGLVPAIFLVIVNSFMAAMGIIIVMKPFLGKSMDKNLQKIKTDRKLLLWLPPIVLALASIILPIFALTWLQDKLIIPASIAINPNIKPITLELWQGFNRPLLLSILTLALGVILFQNFNFVKKIILVCTNFFPKADKVYNSFLQKTMQIAAWQTKLLQCKPLSSYVLLSCITLAFLLFSCTLCFKNEVTLGFKNFMFVEVYIAVFLGIAAIVCVLVTTYKTTIITLGVVGFTITITFIFYGAPDVAKTHLLIEVLTIILMVSFLHCFPHQNTVKSYYLRDVLRAIVAVSIGAMVSLSLMYITDAPLDLTLSNYYSENSLVRGFGRNIVNVILVDFRAFDTLGEIIVVVVAAIIAASLLSSKGEREQK